ncbi:MAG TPA: hypothetical protein VHV30_11675 [Polyangiaceae bacterium]|jgi:hypothetical protein|nr:hypothetical protein [Polyangiaceae bacterium]
MSTLKSSLQSLAVAFAEDVVRAIRGASLQELLGEVAVTRARHGGSSAPAPSSRAAAAAAAAEPATRPAPGAVLGRRGRLKRRSADDIAVTLDRIVSLLKANPAGLRAEQIRKQLGMLAKELPRPLAEGLSSKALRKRGQKRATVYFAAGAAGGEAARVTRKK